MIPNIYTHYGWFLMCPVYVGNLQSDAPYVDARWEWIEWWHEFNLWLFGVFVIVIETIDPDYEPMFPIRLTGEIKRYDVSSPHPSPDKSDQQIAP